MSLQTIRRNIDRIDADILRLLEERMVLARLTTAFKPAIRDAEREKAIVSRLEAKSARTGRLSPGFIAALYGLIFKESRRKERLSKSVREVRP